MSRFSEYLFYIWLISLPFNNYNLVGTLSFDQLLGPTLVVLWLLTQPKSDAVFKRGQAKRIATAIILLSFYFLCHAIILGNSTSSLWTFIYGFLTVLHNFILPILYVRSLSIRRNAEDCILTVTMVGAMSSFLAAIGFLHLELERLSTSRIAIEGLDLTRSIGLFDAFGDMAILSAFSIMLVLSTQRDRVLFFKRTRLIMACIVGVIILGLIGSQSRNMVLTILTSIFAFLIIRRWSGSGSNWIPKFYIFFIGGAVSVALILVFMFDPIVELLSSWGGKSASGTANTRLEQYRMGFVLLDGNYIFGAAADVQDKMGAYIQGIHNMWVKEFVKGGFIAVISMLAFFLVGMRRATKCLKLNPLDEAAILRLALIITLLVSTQFNPSGTEIFWVILGMVLSNSCLRSTPSHGSKSTELSKCSSILPTVKNVKEHRCLHLVNKKV
ncbi:MAG: hypothetical protein QM500_01925 [Methylococcales bacterium]